jgi:hypothetical protein
MKKIIIFLILFFPLAALAAEIDTDGDGLSDEREINLYYTDPNNPDTDGDGYNDSLELINGYSPHVGFAERLINVDQDDDGLNDGYELALQTDLKNSDSDGDGRSDGEEFLNEFDPGAPGEVKLTKTIEVNLTNQYLEYFLGPVRLNRHIVSTGKASTPTPVGEFSIEKKNENAWSALAGLWMPWWMSFNGAYAIHELPEWPGGVKEGADHLGIPVSHGCIRLAIGPAKNLYDWTPIGAKLIIYK